MKTSEQRVNNKKMKKKKKVSKMKKIIIKNAMAIVAIAIAMGSYALMSFGANVSEEETIHFQYKPPTGDPSPYSKANVENLDNWTPTSNPCETTEDEAACSIDVPKANTMNELGLELDPSKVELNTIGSGQVFKVEDPSFTKGKGYTDPINKAIL